MASSTSGAAVMVVGTAIASVPASMLMRRLGRRAGFLIGAVLGIAGSALAATGLHTQSFLWFVLGHLLIGGYQGFANYYRFTAAEASGPKDASRAISWVVAGGVVAAFAGPQIGVWGRDWVPQDAFVGSYVAQALLSLTAMALLSRLHLCQPTAPASEASRSLRELVAQPSLRAAVVGAAVGYAVMIMAMLGCGFGTSEVKPVIQWHVFGMFAPSFFSSHLVTRFGAPRVMQAGFLLLIGHVAIAVTGLEYLHFLSALVLLGVGWSFAFVGATALLTQSCHAGEQAKVQAFNEGVVFSLIAVASLAAGWLHDRFGWTPLNLGMLPVLVVALVWTVAVTSRRLASPALT